MARKAKAKPTQPKEQPRRESTAPAEFVEHCCTITVSVCGDCGGTNLTAIDLKAQKAICLDPECESNKHRKGRGGSRNGRVSLAPTLPEIYGEMSIRFGGTGEQKGGNDSASSVRYKLLAKNPVGSRTTEREPAIREWSFGREIANRPKGFSDK